MPPPADPATAPDVLPSPATPPTDLIDSVTHSDSRVPLIVGSALFMQMLDSTVVATALPAMAVSLDTRPEYLSAAITAYLLAVAMFVPISGWAADRYGARRVFVWAIALFAISSIGCSMAGSVGELVVARWVQGIAGAMMVPVGRLILLRSVPREGLLKAMATLTLPALVGPVIGPPLGGVMVTWLSWHWIFLINVPIAVLGIVMVRRHVPVVPPTDAGPLDRMGFVLSSVALASIILALESIGKGVVPVTAIGALVAVGVGCTFAYVRQARRRDRPLIDLRLMQLPTFRVSVLAGNLCRFTVGSTAFLLAMQFQVGFGMTPVAAGLLTFASAVGAMFMKLLATPILQRWRYRTVLMVNAVLTGAGVMACAAFGPDTAAWAIIGVLLVSGFFRSLQFTAVNTLTYADVSQALMSRASSFASMAQQVGISLGVAVASLSLSLSLWWRGGEHLEAIDIRIALGVIGSLCALSVFGFARLAPDAGEALRATAPVGDAGDEPHGGEAIVTAGPPVARLS